MPSYHEYGLLCAYFSRRTAYGLCGFAPRHYGMILSLPSWCFLKFGKPCCFSAPPLGNQTCCRYCLSQSPWAEIGRSVCMTRWSASATDGFVELPAKIGGRRTTGSISTGQGEKHRLLVHGGQRPYKNTLLCRENRSVQGFWTSLRLMKT